MKLQDGNVMLDDAEKEGIEFLTGEVIPETGMAPGELKAKIAGALAKKRADRPDMNLVWDTMEGLLDDINRLLAAQ